MIYPSDFGGTLKLRQKLSSPSVYLDHAPLRNFASDRALGDRLIGAIKGRNGSLVISRLSSLEFSGLTDLAQAAEADAFHFHKPLTDSTKARVRLL
jgi:hypothetical protein